MDDQISGTEDAKQQISSSACQTGSGKLIDTFSLILYT